MESATRKQFQSNRSLFPRTFFIGTRSKLACKHGVKDVKTFFPPRSAYLTFLDRYILRFTQKKTNVKEHRFNCYRIIILYLFDVKFFACIRWAVKWCLRTFLFFYLLQLKARNADIKLIHDRGIIKQYTAIDHDMQSILRIPGICLEFQRYFHLIYPFRLTKSSI